MNSNTVSQNKTGYASIDRPWRKGFSKEVLAAELPSQTMFEYIYEANKDRSDEIALEYMDMKKVTFGELWQHIEEAAKGLTALGVQPGEIVTIAMPNTPEFVYLAYAVNRVGAVMNLIHPLPGEKELHGYLDEAESRFFFMFDGTYNIIKDSLKETTVQKAIVISPAQSLSGIKRTLYKWAKFPKLDKSMCMTWTEFLKNGEDVAPAYFRKDPDTMAVISHTGGTTGEPKGCMLSDTNENAIAFQVRLSFPGHENMPGKSMLIVLPPFVNYSFCNGIHEGMGMGMRICLVPNYEIGKYHEYHKLHNVAVINSIPQYCQAMLHEKELDGMDLSSLYYIAIGGEAMDSDIEAQFNDFLKDHGADIKATKGYGCTEFSSVVSFTYPEVNFPNSVGVPLPMVNLKIVEPGTTDELKIGETGEVCVSGPSLMLGYYKNQEATDDLIKVHSDGIRWLHMGDLGKVDENGVLYITGRIKRIIMTKGSDGNVTKMFPDRIEKAIQLCEDVELACVIGVRDEERINIPKAFIELKDKSLSDEQAVRNHILAYCNDNLPDYQVPEIIEFVDELPRTPRGKVDYRALEESDIKSA